MKRGQASKGDILIVDDNPVNLELLSGMLTERGYRVRVATGGRRAMTAALSAPPELIMLDINLPDLDGYEVCSRLKEQESVAHVPVIFISALDTAVDKVRAFGVGGADYVTKPFQFEEVLARVENQLKLSRLQQALERKNRELLEKHEALVRSKEATLRSQRRAEVIFSALQDALTGTVLDDKYHLENRIGSGGFGAVYRARHLGLGRHVAVKVFRPPHGEHHDEALERFRLEGVTACRVNHPNAVAVLDFGVSSSGIAYLVMELLEGHTLGAEIRKLRTLSVARAVEVLVPVCHALAAAHAAGLVHRDIKPDNIFLHQAADGESVKVVDFGIAKLMGESTVSTIHTISNPMFLGTPAYISPERLDNQPYDGRADVYSVGILLYEMLCGHVPFQAYENEHWAVAMMHLNKAPTPPRIVNPQIPVSIERVILKTLCKDPAQRPSAEQLASMLAECADAE